MTGLATVDMATHWSLFGHVVIFVGVQIGAIGVLTVASILGLVVSRRLRLRSRLMAASDSNPLRAHAGPVPEGQAVRLGEVGGLLTTVAVSALAIELVIGILLVPRLLIDGIPGRTPSSTASTTRRWPSPTRGSPRTRRASRRSRATSSSWVC
ncbi:hypothetical protein GCM10025867_40320 [Frondihabitans sucicola]|uniref:Uncharacterized protein n=1 Tax=Frondihabitans sucicola TaxID=1268041 RepID=A0ABM8GTJ6_9MICO|nr:hypothetical protein GCM10025867_40320 [Frondihabitans sucicola]